MIWGFTNFVPRKVSQNLTTLKAPFLYLGHPSCLYNGELSSNASGKWNGGRDNGQKWTATFVPSVPAYVMT